MRSWSVVWMIMAAFGSAAPFAAMAEAVGPQEAAQWLRRVIPLPKQAAIENKVVVAPDRIVLALRPEASSLERAAAGELAGLFREKTGKEVALSVGEKKADFRIILGVCDARGRILGTPIPGVEGLAKLSCHDQAYLIAPLGADALALAALDPKGVYYAAKTFKQLLFSAFTKEGVVAVPLAKVLDWPDMAERGLWGGSANEDIEWMAERKMNLVEAHASLSIAEDGRGVAKIADGLLARAQSHAVNLVPIITHLEQFPGVVFARFPELQAKGDPEKWRKIGDVRPVCFSQPRAQQILSDWLCDLARYPEVTDVNVWLSENNVPCDCEKCKVVDPFVLQTTLAVRAWEAAKRLRQDIRLRILLTQGSYKSNDKVLAAAPREVGITYYDGGRTYDSSRNPMIYPLLEEYAAKGGWLGCYPQLTASWRIVCPWSAPQFIRARMTEFVSKKLRCLCGYATPSNRFYDFNVTAAAEWSWNAGGRDEREFSAAWAVREGLSDPEKAADWAVMLGPVGWDVYGSRVPYSWVYGNIGGLLKAGRSPQLGSGIFTYFPTREHFDGNLAVCDRAMALARELKAPALVAETRVIRGVVRMLKGLYLLAGDTVKGDKMSPDEKAAAGASLALVDEGSREARDGLLAWGEAVASRLMARPPSRFADTANCIEAVMSQVSDIVTGYGMQDPNRPYRSRQIGRWVTEDFKTGRDQTKTWEVTSFVAGPGRYQVYFQYEKGWYGAGIRRVRMVSASALNGARSGPAADPSQQKELACDDHEGITGHSPKDTLYALDLKEHDPARRYFIVADLRGVPPNSPPDKQGCEGRVNMKKIKE